MNPMLQVIPAGLAAKQVLVIGGGSGIGLAVARAAAGLGAKVILAGRNEERLVAMVDELPGGALARPLDLTDEAAVAQFFEQLGALDHLVVTAGPSIGSATLPQLDLREAQAAVDVKLWGAIRAAKHAAARIASGGSITLTSGVVRRRPGPGSLVKTITNAAIEAAAKGLARELAPVRVNVVSPGPTETGIWDYLGPDERAALFEQLAKNLPVGAIGAPEDVAQAYLFAMQNCFATGSVIDVDGGALVA